MYSTNTYVSMKLHFYNVMLSLIFSLEMFVL